MGGDGRKRMAKRTWVLAGLLVVAVGVGAAVLVTRPDEPEGKFCAGVGLIGSGTYPTAEEAFAAWLADNPDQPPRSDWTRGPDIVGGETGRRSVEYETTKSTRYWSVGVGTGEFDEDGELTGVDRWRASGGCVRSS